MISSARWLSALVLVAHAAAQASSDDVAAARYARLPLAFEPVGPAMAEPGCYVARGPGYAALVGPKGVRLALDGKDGARARVAIGVVGADGAAAAVAQGDLPGRSHYLIGGDAAAWRTGVRQYRRVRFERILPGVDAVYYGNQRELEYDLVLAPGARPEAIELHVLGGSGASIGDGGALVIEAGGGRLEQRPPVCYQEIGGERRPVDARYVARGEGRFGFALGAYDPTRPLVIDPVLQYGSYFGGAGEDVAVGLARDVAGNVYMTGMTSSAGFPLQNPLQPQIAGFHDIFVSKVDPTGTQLLYSTFVGGTGPSGVDDWPMAIGVDGLGQAVVFGRTETADFPTQNAAQPAPAGGVDAVVFKLDATGAGLVYSTYLGGSGNDVDFGTGPAARSDGGVAVDAAGNATVSAATWSTDFPTRNAMQPQHAGGQADGFVTRYGPNGAVIFSTYLGGSDFDQPRDAWLGREGHVYLTGESRSDDFPLTPGAYNTTGPLGFALELDPTTQAVVRSTRFPVDADAVAVDAAGDVYLAGTSRGGVPTTRGSHQPLHGGSFQSHWEQGFVVKLDAALSRVIYGTYFGSPAADEEFRDIAIDAVGQVYIAGTWTNHYGNDRSQALALKLNQNGSSFPFVMFLGGVSSDGNAVALGDPGEMWIAGETWASSGLATAGAIQPVQAGSRDAFLARVSHGTSRLDALSVETDRMNGNTTIEGTVLLDGVAPAGGITVALASSDPAVAAVPPSVVVPAGAASATFPIRGAPVPGAVDLQITAAFNGQETQALRVWPGPTYRVVPIGAPERTEGRAINGFGLVAGHETQTGRFFRFTLGNAYEPLGIGDAYAINDLGQIAGGDRVAWRFTEGVGLENLGSLQPGEPAKARGINNRGQVAGTAGVVIGFLLTTRAFLYTNGVGMQNLGALGDISEAWDVNNSGQVTGQTDLASGAASRAFRFTQDIGMIELGALPGHTQSIGFAINDSGQVTGRSATSLYGESRAFRYTDGIGMEDLGLLPGDSHGAGWGINTFGHVVGWSNDLNTTRNRATRWVGGGAEELSDMVSSQDAFDWDMWQARGVNDRGEITGFGAFPQWAAETGFRLDPLFFAPYGRGCAGTAGAPPGLLGLGYPVTGNTVTVALSGKPLSGAVILIAASPGQTPLAGCELLVGAPFFGLPGMVLDRAGTAQVALQLPPGAPAVSLFFQGLVLDPAAPTGLFSTSNGLEMRIPY